MPHVYMMKLTAVQVLHRQIVQDSGAQPEPEAVENTTVMENLQHTQYWCLRLHNTRS